MSRNGYIFWIAALVAAAVSSCSGDLGNYTYHDLNEPLIEGIEKDIYVMKEASLEISTTITGGIGEKNYDYEWKVIDQGNDNAVEVIGMEKDLSIPEVKMAPGVYSLYYTLTEKETGVFWQTEATLTVSTHMSEGWMVLCSDNGKSRLDFVSDVEGLDKSVYFDVLKDNAGMPVFTGPRRIMWIPSNTDENSPYYLLAESGATRLGKDAFEWTEEYDMAYEMGSNASVAPHDIISAWSVKVMVAGTDVHYCSIISDDIGGLYSTPVNKDFKAAPRIGTNAVLNSQAMVAVFLLYDMDNKRFMGYSPMLADQEFNEQSLADMNKMEEIAVSQDKDNVIKTGFGAYPEGMDYVWMENTRWDPINAGMGVTYTVLAEGDERHVYGIQLGDILRQSSNKYAIVRSYKGDVSSCTDIVNAEFFAFSSMRSYMYYSVGNKVYGVPLDDNIDDCKLMLELPGEITFMKFNLYQTEDDRHRSNDLIVGFEENGEGKFRVYEGGFEANGDFSGITPKEYKGNADGKFATIVDVTYKERN